MRRPSPDLASKYMAQGLSINVGQWRSATRKANTFIAQLNITEKAGLLTGNLLNLTCGGIIINAIPRLGFPGLCLQDGPAGIRTADLASVFSAGISIGATWDRGLIYERGRALGEEFRGKGAHVVLGPSTGPLGRIPLGRRNWESFSVDPYLSGIATSATVRGIQDSGVQACTKHYVGNEQETQRTLGVVNGVEVDAISSKIDHRTLHELYIWPFADAVRAGTLSIMCSYNQLNSTYACEDDHTLKGILKEELGFKGYAVSDWFATNSNFTDSYFGSNLVNAVQSGHVSTQRLHDMVRRVLTPYFCLGQDKDYPTIDPSGLFVSLVALTFTPSMLGIPNDTPLPTARDVRADHVALIRKHGAAGTTIAVFGNDAADSSRGSAVPVGAAYAPPQGVEMGEQVMGGGAGSGRLSYVVSPLDALRDARELQQQHVNPNSTAVVNGVASYCPSRKTVVVTHSAGINTMPWAENPNEAGNSIVDILFGHMNPSGHLPHTIARNENDYNTAMFNVTLPAEATDPAAWQSDFTEGLLFDYRHFDANDITPLYEFGYGLSYTTFDLTGNPFPTKVKENSPGGNPHLWKTLFTVPVRSRSSVPAATPVKVLRGFDKVYLEPGEEKEISFPFMRRDMSYWDI
ncbi:glycoside hydrolase superfamily [Aspergillus keveii]|uniref:Probable beta-glucosidase G n=1 Tax=Aspergillus keveii TaxID=714993 RepID=A0ABR4FHN7_9EURO